MNIRLIVAALVIGAGGSVLAAGVLPANGRPAGTPAQSDLDEFMRQVIARRDENWKKLQQYILDEREQVEVRGPVGVPIWGERREYAWFIEDGFFVRSPTKVDGVDVPEGERREYEARFLREAKARDAREKEKEKENTGAGASSGTGAQAGDADATGKRVPDEPDELGDLLSQSSRPRFVDSAYFLKFKFEQGKYAFVGRETFEGRDVLRIEYYPERLFAHEQDTQRERRREGRNDRGEDAEAAIERMMNKVSLVTLWVEPASHQIVKYTFDNVNLDFLPAAWLVRMDDLQAQMTMSQPFPDVWLPRDVEFHFAALLAVGPFDVRYRINYHDYREAKTSGRIRGIGGGGGR
ncbi:MAG: hypothetical protein R2752_16290 [Vicinamibacterales bacterium]